MDLCWLRRGRECRWHVGEAMAMEKPVVATDVGGVRELVGDAGVIVPPKAPDALAVAMLELMQRTPEDRHTLGMRRASAYA